MVLAVFSRSLQGGEMYQEGPGHEPATLTPICPGPGFCPLAAGSDMLDPSMAAPESWLMSLALASSKEVSFQTGQLIHGHGMDFMMRPTDAAVAVSITALGEPSSTGGSISDHTPLHRMPQLLGSHLKGCEKGQHSPTFIVCKIKCAYD